MAKTSVRLNQPDGLIWSILHLFDTHFFNIICNLFDQEVKIQWNDFYQGISFGPCAYKFTTNQFIWKQHTNFSYTISTYCFLHAPCALVYNSFSLKKRVRRFSNHSIVSAPQLAIVKPDAVSELNYKCENDSGFHVLFDEASIIGVQKSDSKVIVRENLRKKSQSLITYNAAISEVNTLVVDEHSNALLAGENNHDQGRVVQYRLDTGSVVKDYGALGIGQVYSSARLGNLCAFGGWDKSSFTIIDALTQRVVQKPVTAAVKSITSLAFCTKDRESSSPDSVLVVAGYEPDYSQNRRDMFDVTGLVTQYVKPNQKANTDPIQDNALSQTVAKLQNQLQQQARMHQIEVEAKNLEIQNLQNTNQSLYQRIESLSADIRNLNKKRVIDKRNVRRSNKKRTMLAKQNILVTLANKMHERPELTVNDSSMTESTLSFESRNLVRELNVLRRDSRNLRMRNETLLQEKRGLQIKVETLNDVVSRLGPGSGRCSQW